MNPSRGRWMLSSIRKRLTFANVLASAAVFIALGGASYAAVSVPLNSVGSRQVQAHSIQQADLARGSVGSGQLRRRSVTAPKLASRGVTKRTLSPWIRTQLRRRAAPGSPGPRGPEGAAGPRGPGAVPVRYSVAAGGTPAFATVFETGGLTLEASCEVSGGTTTLNLSVGSAQAATLYETITTDAGTDPNTPSPADSANLQIDLPAGTTSPGGGPAATDGYVRVAAEGVYISPSGTLDFHLFLFVSDDAGADTGNCSISGVIVPT
jgi:hypothetical protein